MLLFFFILFKKVKYKHQIKNKFLLAVLLSLLVVLCMPMGVSSEPYSLYVNEDLGETGNKQKNERVRKISIPVNKYSKDVNRFIAHAGGQIDGKRITNSLEALNLNYKLGFRLFELDIIKTSDNIYVAYHDWVLWAESTGYKGSLPPTRDVFKKYKIQRKFTPLDMTDINIWFNKHPDAMLVTDKVNEPLEFSNKFIDKNRLIMELFSLKAIKDGVAANIKIVMANWIVLSEMAGYKAKKLKAMGVTTVAASRRVIYKQKRLLNSLKRAGIKVYAFELNPGKSSNEVYVVCNERDYFYGIYADKWNFESELDCKRIRWR